MTTLTKQDIVSFFKIVEHLTKHDQTNINIVKIDKENSKMTAIVVTHNDELFQNGISDQELAMTVDGLDSQIQHGWLETSVTDLAELLQIEITE